MLGDRMPAERLQSLMNAAASLRSDLPAVEWRAGKQLELLQQLAQIVADVVGERLAGEPRNAADQEREMARRAVTVEHLLWLACRALPPDLDGLRRDSEVCRVLRSWGVTPAELHARGYGEAD